jgi:predicted MPP superfamily phosphohydrolase
MSLLDRPGLTRREFLRHAAKLTAGTALATVGYGGIFERTHVVVQRVEVVLDRLPEVFNGLTIAQLSDLHYHPYFSADVIRHAVNLVMNANPDLVALTGDFVTLSEFKNVDFGAAKAAVPCAELLAPLQPRLGVFAVLGNHDTYTDPEFVVEAFSSRKIRVLQNEALPLERDGQRIWVAGVNDVLAGLADLDTTLLQVPPGEAVILLAHEPDFADRVARYPVDLQLSGHSHGGQIRLPFLSPPVLPALARKYPQGLRKVGRTALYTNIGLGTIIVPMRILAAPEVTLLTLRIGKQTGSVGYYFSAS